MLLLLGSGFWLQQSRRSDVLITWFLYFFLNNNEALAQTLRHICGLCNLGHLIWCIAICWWKGTYELWTLSISWLMLSHGCSQDPLSRFFWNNFLLLSILFTTRLVYLTCFPLLSELQLLINSNTSVVIAVLANWVLSFSLYLLSRIDLFLKTLYLVYEAYV